MKRLIYILVFLFYGVGFCQDFEETTVRNQNVDLPITGSITDTLTTISKDQQEFGYRVWSWNDTQLPNTANDGTVSFSNGHLKTSFECKTTVTKVLNENKLAIDITPEDLQQYSNCQDGNMRGEISMQTNLPEHTNGTENWWSIRYEWDSSYVIDNTESYLIYQNFDKFQDNMPPIQSLTINATNGSFGVGEIMIVNNGTDNNNTTSGSRYSTGVTPVANMVLDVVFRVVYGDEATGVIQCWMRSDTGSGFGAWSLVVDEQERTVRPNSGEGGHDKFGAYKSGWRNQSGIDTSALAGVTSLRMYLGPIRQWIKSPSDPTNGDDIKVFMEPYD